MQNIKANSITQEQISDLLLNKALPSQNWAYSFWLYAMQEDLKKAPVMFNIDDCKVVGGNPTFPPLPNEKIGLMFLSSGTYEAAVVGGADKWRRLYDGTTFDPATNIP